MADKSKEQGEALVWAGGGNGGQSDSSICPRAVQQGGLALRKGPDEQSTGLLEGHHQGQAHFTPWV